RAGAKMGANLLTKIFSADSATSPLPFNAGDAARRTGQGPQGSPCNAFPRAARTSARLVSYCAPAGLAVPGPEPGRPDVDAPAHARLPCGRPHGRDRQARVPAYAAA